MIDPVNDVDQGGQTVAAVGEFGLIAELTKRFPTGAGVVLGPGDDAAVATFDGGQVVATTDLLVERRHFRRDWSSAYEVGRKAAAQNLVDVVAMGARPRALLLGLGLPGDLPVSWVLELADGLAAECDQLEVAVIGGDVVGSDDVVISITALGALVDRAPVTRAGARVDDVVAVCGRLGWASAGYAVLARGFRSPRVVVEAHRLPEPPYDAGEEAVDLGVHALIDVSDGLLADLGHIAVASGVGIAIDSDTLEVPEPLRTVGTALNVDPLAYVLTGGEDHALVGTFPPTATLPERWRAIGRVTETVAGVVTVDGEAYDGPTASYDHFSR